MSNDTKVPDQKLATMIASWKPFDLSDKRSIGFRETIRSNEARRWLSDVRDILPDDQTILSDRGVCNILTVACSKSGQVGAGWYWEFSDNSAIVARSGLDKVFDRWG